MDYLQAIDRLWNHSNLPRSFSSENESLIYGLYQANRTNISPMIEPLVDDVIKCLEIVNFEINGSKPSMNINRANQAALVDVSYPISGIICDILIYYRRWQRNNLYSIIIQDSLLDVAIKVSYAWDQILAGDIDDLLEGLELE
jgi:hypothetical protein